MGKTDIKPYGIDKKISTRFKDVAGQEAAKLEITEFVEFLRKPEKYKSPNPKPKLTPPKYFFPIPYMIKIDKKIKILYLVFF